MQIFDEPLTEQQITSIHKLADGIECGAKLRPQTRGRYFQIMPLDKTEQLCSCALGAALECYLNNQGIQLGIPDNHELGLLTEIKHSTILEFYSVENQHITHAFWIKGDIEYMFDEAESLSGIIWRMNDYLYWTREQIADWLRQLT